MLQATFTYDLFDPEKGTLSVDYNIFESVKESGMIPYSMVRTQMETRVRQIICDRIDRMRNQRRENYKYGELWSAAISDALISIPTSTIGARGIRDMRKFAIYVRDVIRPKLHDISPSPTSRFRDGYMRKLDLLDYYINFLLENPGFCDLSIRAEKENIAI